MGNLQASTPSRLNCFKRRTRNSLEKVWKHEKIPHKWKRGLIVKLPIDFEKAFDSIHRESLWLIMRKYGIPDKIVRMVKVFYEDFDCAVEDQAEAYEWFNIKTGVKQGCNMPGFLFLIAMDWIRRKWNQVELYI